MDLQGKLLQMIEESQIVDSEAARDGNLEKSIREISEINKDIEQKALLIAQVYDRPEIVRYLMNPLEDNLKFLNSAERGDLDFVKNQISKVSKFTAEQAIQEAAYAGQIEIVRFLLEAGVKDESRCVYSAICGNQLEMVQFLIEEGSSSDDIIRLAIQFEKLEILKYGVSLRPLRSEDLEKAIRSRNIEIVEFIIETNPELINLASLLLSLDNREIFPILFERATSWLNLGICYSAMGIDYIIKLFI